jgi:aminopeptidase N
MTYTNNSPDALRFLWLQLDQNIYQKDSRGSSTTTQTGGRWANASYTKGYSINNLRAEQGLLKYAVKDALTTDTRTQLPLDQPLKTGEKIKIALSYEFEIPEYGTDRMGRLKTKNGWIYEVAQWFPRVCVYDDLHGWNTMPYLGAGEFYLEYGDIDFSITAPSDLIVVGSGELINQKDCFTADQIKRWEKAAASDQTVTIRGANEIGDRTSRPATANTTWRFKIQNTRDVAWAASKAFILDAAKINLPSGKKCMAMSAYPAESIKEKGWQLSTEMVKGSIEHYSSKWFEYPYAAAVNVAGIVGGMEYPGIVFCSWESAGTALWGVTDHEFGHIWFPMIVGSNERKFAWMDEGFNTFINDLSTQAFKNGEFKEESVFSDPNSSFLVKYTFSDQMDGLYNIPDVIQEDNLGITAYMKPAQMLHALRNEVLGEARFDRALKEYIRRWAYKHPTPWDFFHTMENVSGENLSWFWRAWVLNSWKLDVSVKSVKANEGKPENGSTVTVANLEQMVMPVMVDIKEANGKSHRIKLPVEVWMRGAEYTFRAPTTSEIIEVGIDPDKKLPDMNRANNGWKKR